MSAAVIETVQSGRDLANAILTRRLRKCIAEGVHTVVVGKCERCGI
jgi:hypothetical protein